MALDPVDGGNGNVNGDFKILSQEPTVLTLGDGTVKDAVTVRARELAYNVEYGFTMPTDQWQGAIFKTYARVIASYIQEIGGMDHVVDIYSAQDTDRRGLLHDYLWITVATPDGNNEAVVRVLQDQANSQKTFKAITDAYATLVNNLNAS